jgi:murein L,D-transpeptidase YafK
MNALKSLPKAKAFVRSLAWIVTLLALSSCSWFGSTKSVTPPKKSIEVSAPRDCGLPYCTVDLNASLWLLSNPMLYVQKSERRLLLVDNKVLLRDYPIALGFQPKGDKYMRGDGRTPEGDFFVCVKNPSSKYYKGFGINYPSPKHAEEAYMLGAISRDEYLKILQANEKKTLPPDGTRLGGDIFIHGGGAGEDWTLGCVALSNSNIEELFDVIPVGTPVKILP